MNPIEPPLQPLRSSTSCNRHPDELFTSFCPSCLCERLSGLDPTSSSSSSRKPSTSSTAAAALKSIFRPPPASSLLPELRKTKSFSSSRNDPAFSAIPVEPQRKSCDVRARTSVSNILIEKKTILNSNEDEGNTKNLEEKDNQEEDVVEDGVGIRVLEELNSGYVNLEIEEEEEEKDELEVKTMKAHIDLNSSQPKKSSKDSKGGFWSAASVFSNKLQKWRQKQKMKKHRNETESEDVSTTLPVEKPIGRQFRETQSEVAEYGLGRRSCNTDPRFSLDIGRMSFDNDPRFSFDEPRASWDGYWIERTTVPRMPSMLSVVEDAPVHVLRTDTQIPVEEPISDDDDGDDDSNVPGGSAQTREYYDSSSRRKKSLDRSNSIMKTAAAIVAEMDELKCSSIANTNANVNASKLGGLIDGDLSSNSMRDDCCLETVDLGFKDGASVIGNGDQKRLKKSRRWSKAWSIWGFIHRRGGNKDEDEDRYSSANNGARHSFSESWQDLRGDRNGNGDGRGAFNGGLFRSNSSVSWRNAQSVGGSFGTLRRNVSQSNGHGKKAKDEFVLERNKSARYTPKDIDNGLLRLYLTPSRGSRRNSSTKSSNQSYSIARTVPRMY
ncbi:hypothetical protein TanjilG_08258 [Lupinus angustifolius]|uniref:Uncharacterized protein n=1 Tax=Lupinus angustifolius TaxID=3871 RepID=A0A394D9Y1_LUPAN|nr:PREDICTED: UPF0503 protein At3g09070, chloroplastic-like [Lupinus angustifolius]OIW20298.1 hypothetical protein TanjilG_08258 [Lupinus angustifolius]